MRRLGLDVDSSPRIVQANGITLGKACDPHIRSQLENIVRMRSMRLGAIHLAIVNLTRKSAPRTFVQHIPFPQNFAFWTDLDDHIQSSIGDQKVAVVGGCDMMKIVEARQGNIADLFECRNLKNQNLG